MRIILRNKALSVGLCNKARQKLKIANLEKGCFAFNTQAAQAIQRLNLVNWQQGDSSDIGPFFGRRNFVYDMSE